MTKTFCQVKVRIQDLDDFPLEDILDEDLPALYAFTKGVQAPQMEAVVFGWIRGVMQIADYDLLAQRRPFLRAAHKHLDKCTPA